MHIKCHITAPTICTKHSNTKQYMKIAKCKHTYYNHAYNIALSAMYTIQQKE